MSWWSRIGNVFRSDRVTRELQEEIDEHIQEAIERGRDPIEARRAFGPPLRLREDSRDIKLSSWLESLRADAVFGWRQILKNKASSLAAILSLALAIGACTSAFRLIDAVLLRPMPVVDPGSLFCLTYEYIGATTGKSQTSDSFEYPFFRVMRSSVADQAELHAISYLSRVDLTYASDHEMEKAFRQYVGGDMFRSFGIRPALGRLLQASDDVKAGEHPYAVLSYDYWTSRFGADPNVLGRSVRIGDTLFEIVGVAEKGFTGSETGFFTDIFIPTMMNTRAIDNPNWGWFRTWVRIKLGQSVDEVRHRLQAAFTAYRKDRAKTWGGQRSQQRIDEYVNTTLTFNSAAAGFSGTQRQYRRSLIILGAVVALVLLIACANLANLMMAQAGARSREMALRVSLGAGRARLVQLVLVESAQLALMASALGALFAWWSAPMVVGMINPPDNPARLTLPADWRVLGFAAGLAIFVTFLFGLAPALRASAVKPMSALKGDNVRSQWRLTSALVAMQVAFCVLVLFAASLFAATFERLTNQPTGFNSERLLALETTSKGEQPQAYWDQVAEQLRTASGVESVGTSSWAVFSGNGWSDQIQVNGQRIDDLEPYFLGVSRAWLQTMKIGMIDGRDFTLDDAFPNVAIVNEAFAKRYFEGQNPVGKAFEMRQKKELVTVRIVGYAKDARYRDMREAIRPTVYVPFRGPGTGKDWGTFMVRTAGDPLPVAQMLRQQVRNARPDFRVTSIRTQGEMVRANIVRERLLATLSLFFAAVALLLAGVGLYGVLNYSMLQRRREIGIRMALGARAGDVARRVTSQVFWMLFAGLTLGIGAGMASERYVTSLLFHVKATDLALVAIPAAAILAAALLAALAPVVRAVRIDPATTLRAD